MASTLPKSSPGVTTKPNSSPSGGYFNKSNSPNTGASSIFKNNTSRPVSMMPTNSPSIKSDANGTYHMSH